jgi:Na+/H+ antiporter NhaD/arsenite permease-like protein
VDARVAVFVLVYAAMLLGGIPGLALDRTGAALLGAIVLVASDALPADGAWAAVDVPTLCLLFGLMVVSAQFRLAGFYSHVTRRLAAADVSPQGMLGLLVVTAGVLSALLANDIVCLAMTPIVIEGCAQRRLRPLPFLLALACASNVGSAATLIGNPQNMLIGEALDVSFAGYVADALVPTVLGLGIVWGVVAWTARGRWSAPSDAVPTVTAPPFDRVQAWKGGAVLVVLVTLFLTTSWPRDHLALAAAGLVLTSRRMASRPMLALVDWHLLVLFVGLFVVNGAFAATGLPARALASLRDAGVDLTQPAWLFGTTVVLSNLVSNVPAVMLLLPAATHALAGPILALASTLAGNLFLVGSIANLIVAEQAAPLGVRIGWADHARVGVPITLMTLLVAAVWLALRAFW